jgi:hypothetical protein
MIDVEICTTPCELCPFKLNVVICEDPLGYTKSKIILCRYLIVASCVMFTIGIASIYLVNMSIVMNRNLNPLSALGKAPTISIPQIANEQDRLMG